MTIVSADTRRKQLLAFVAANLALRRGQRLSVFQTFTPDVGWHIDAFAAMGSRDGLVIREAHVVQR